MYIFILRVKICPVVNRHIPILPYCLSHLPSSLLSKDFFVDVFPCIYLVKDFN